MIAPELPINEANRLAELLRYGILDTLPDVEFDRVTSMASRLFSVPIALVSLVDENRQWFKSCVGLDASETPRNISFCGHAILDDDILVIEDATQDERFHDNPLVQGAPNIRFYAGAPLTTRQGYNLGTLCLIDRSPRSLSAEERTLLRDLADIVIDALEARHLFKRNAESFRFQLANLSDAIEISQDGIALIDEHGKIAYANSAQHRLSGYSAGGLTDLPAEALIERSDCAGTPLSDALEYVLLQSDPGDAARICQLRITDIDGRRIVSTRDITAIRMAEDESRALKERLHQGEKLEAIGRLAGGVAHDFNNILAGILGYADLILEDLSPEDPQREMIEHIISGGIRARDLVAQILTFARSRQVDQDAAINLRDAVKELEPLIRPHLPDAIALDITLPPGKVYCTGNSSQIAQILMNLALNAKDAMEDRSGEIRIELAPNCADRDAGVESHAMTIGEPQEGQFHRISVTDTGCGMDRATMARIFEPFFTTKIVGKGTGLGLSAVHGLVKAHSGWLRVSSVAGKGTRFDVFLPARNATSKTETDAEQQTRDRAAKPSKDHDAHILIVDDEPAVRASMATALRRAGYRVSEAASSAEAIQITEKTGDVALAVIDQTMPGGSGLTLMSRMRHTAPNVITLLCSAFLDPQIETQARLHGARDVLVKPVMPKQLVKSVETGLAAGPNAEAA